jgi:hypothetical protein
MQADVIPGKQVSFLGAVAVVATSYFLVVIAAMHVLSPDINPVDRPTSEYATGPFGYLMTSAFVALSVATWALIVGLWRDLPPRGIHRIGLVALGVFGLGLLVAAAFPIDPEGAAATLAGNVHQINGPIAFLGLIVGANLASRGLKDDPRWRSIYRPAFILALLMIPLFIAGGVAAAREAGAGLAQRILIVTFGAWYMLVATRLRRA